MVQSCIFSAAGTLGFLGFDPVLYSCAEIPDFPSIEGVQTGISVNEGGLSKVKKLWIMSVILEKWQKYYFTKIYILNLVYRLEHARSKMASLSQTSLGTETTCHYTVLRMVRWRRHQWFPSTLFYFVLNVLCALGLMSSFPFPSLSFLCLVLFQTFLPSSENRAQYHDWIQWAVFN